MSNVLGTIFSALTGDTFKVVADVVDKVVDSKDQREIIKADLQVKLAELTSGAEVAAQDAIQKEGEQVTERLRIDMGSDSRLSKNVRPIVLLFLDGAMVGLAYSTSLSTSITQNQINALGVWIPLFQTLLVMAHIFYFGGRSIEKVTNLIQSNKSGD